MIILSPQCFVIFFIVIIVYLLFTVASHSALPFHPFHTSKCQILSMTFLSSSQCHPHCFVLSLSLFNKSSEVRKLEDFSCWCVPEAAKKKMKGRQLTVELCVSECHKLTCFLVWVSSLGSHKQNRARIVAMVLFFLAVGHPFWNGENGATFCQCAVLSFFMWLQVSCLKMHIMFILRSWCHYFTSV